MKRAKTAIIAVQALALFFGASACSASASNPKVEIEMEDGGKIDLQLDRKNAPITVDNFISLVSSGFYNGLTFHRIAPGFVIQGGDPNGDGTGGSSKAIKGEFAANGVQNKISHKRGVISMARSQDPNSASCQFFITLSDDYTSVLDGQYAAFGKVISGMDEVDKIAAMPNSGPPNNTALQPPVIKSIKVVS